MDEKTSIATLVRQVKLLRLTFSQPCDYGTQWVTRGLTPFNAGVLPTGVLLPVKYRADVQLDPMAPPPRASLRRDLIPGLGQIWVRLSSTEI